MKRILGVALFLMSFASAALADGPGLPPPPGKSPKALKAGVVLLADGPGLPPPPGEPTKTLRSVAA